MKRQINNLLFLFGFMMALQMGNLNYSEIDLSLLSKTIPKDTDKIISEQNNHRALPGQAYLNAYQSFREGKYINKTYAMQRVEGIPFRRCEKTTSTTNHGRDSP